MTGVRAQYEKTLLLVPVIFRADYLQVRAGYRRPGMLLLRMLRHQTAHSVVDLLGRVNNQGYPMVPTDWRSWSDGAFDTSG